MIIDDNGIIQKVNQAKNKTNESYENEGIKLAVTSSMMENIYSQKINKSSLENAIKSQFGNNTGFTVTENGDNSFIINSEKTNKRYFVNKNGYVSNKEFLYSVVNIGDYVDYKEGTNNSYISYSELNGYQDKVFTTNNTIKWKVLEKKDGKVYLISDDIIKSDDDTELTFCGKVAYLNGIKELNNICNIYGKGYGAESARSINAQDIIKLTCNMEDYDVAITNYDTKAYVDGYDFFDENGNATTNIVRNYQYYVLLHQAIDKNTTCYPILFLTDKEHQENSTIYWLGTQGFNGNTTGAWYAIMETYYGTESGSFVGKCYVNGRHCYKANGDSVARSSNIRPIVILNSNLTTDGKIDNEVWSISRD